jgi:rhomboid protease GluP
LNEAHPECVRIRLRPQTLVLAEWVLLVECVVMVGLVAWGAYLLLGRGAPVSRHVFVMLALVLASVAPMLHRILRRRRGETEIEIGAGVARLPATFAPRRHRNIPLSDVRSIHRRTTGRHPGIAIGVSSGAAVSLREQEFAEPDGAGQLEASLRAAIAAEPDGAARIAAIDRRSRFAASMARGVPRACVALCLAVGALFGVEVLHGGWNPGAALYVPVRFGALVAPLVQAGEWWRIVSANFLHANPFHLAMNAFGFVVCGVVLERWIGPAKTLLIALASGLGGVTASLLFQQAAVSLGASTMAMGLYAAWVVAIARYRHELPHLLPVWMFAVIAGLLVAGEFAAPNIDHLGHAGGALAGVATLLLLARDADPLSLRAPSRGVRVALVALGSVYAVGLAQMAAYAWSWSDARRLAVSGDLLASPRAGVVNFAAWDVATLPGAPREMLERAAARMREVEAPAGAEAAFLDTRATLAWRLGDLDSAMTLERDALARSSDRFHASQLARFARARLAASGAPLAIGAVPARVEVRIEAAQSGEPGPRVVVVELGAQPARAVEVHAIAVDAAVPVAYLRLLAAPDAGPLVRIAGESAAFQRWADAVRLEVTLVGESDDLGSIEHRWQLWTLDPAVAALP